MTAKSVSLRPQIMRPRERAPTCYPNDFMDTSKSCAPGSVPLLATPLILWTAPKLKKTNPNNIALI